MTTPLPAGSCEREPNYDAACFHAQQCVEKYLKALLQEGGHTILRTHNLETLAKPPLMSHAALQGLIIDFRTLTAYAVESRYPGKTSDHNLARDALSRCKKVRSALRKAMRLSQ